MLAARVGTVLTEERTRRRAVEALEAKTEFVANVNHELRAPASGVIGIAEVLASEIHGPLTDKQRDLISKARTASEHLLSLVQDVGDLFRLDADAMELTIERLRPHDIVAKAAAMVEVSALDKGLKFAADVDTALPEIVGDDRRLVQILVNLLSNAIRFTPEDGELGIEAQPRDGSVVFCVWDSGPGIPEEHLDGVFERYVQAHRGGAGSGGTGLGLALSRELADIQGGTMWVESTLGAGSRFYVALPMAHRPDRVE